MAYDSQNPFGGGASPYDAARSKAVQQAGAQSAQGMDAINRRFAAMGNSNSGAAIKAQQTNDTGIQQGLQDTLGNITMGEADNASKQNFANQQMGNQQAFQSNQANQQRELEKQKMAQQSGQFQAEFGEKQNEFAKESQQKQQQLDQEAKAMEINASMNEWTKSHSGGLLGAGGFLGTGIG